MQLAVYGSLQLGVLWRMAARCGEEEDKEEVTGEGCMDGWELVDARGQAAAA